MYNALDLISNTAGDTVICIYELNTWKAETEGLRQQGQPGLQSKWDSIQKKKKKKVVLSAAAGTETRALSPAQPEEFL